VVIILRLFYSLVLEILFFTTTFPNVLAFPHYSCYTFLLSFCYCSLCYSLTEAEKHFLHNKGLHIVGLQWLEDCLERNQRLQEETYSLKPFGWEEFNIEEWWVQIYRIIFVNGCGMLLSSKFSSVGAFGCVCVCVCEGGVLSRWGGTQLVEREGPIGLSLEELLIGWGWGWYRY
jgi:hypothetical protein